MDYIQAKARVFAFLTENNYCSTIIRATKNCFDNLEAFLCNQEQDYSPWCCRWMVLFCFTTIQTSISRTIPTGTFASAGLL